MAIQIISLHKFDDVFAVWTEDEDTYRHYYITPHKKDLRENFKKKDYRDKEHFMGVIGKFSPETLFLIKPIIIEKFSFPYLELAYKKLP